LIKHLIATATLTRITTITTITAITAIITIAAESVAIFSKYK
jgi:hypothetical protein